MRKKYLCLLMICLLTTVSVSVFAQKADFSGIVTDEKGRPIVGVTIQLEPDRHLTQTDEKGKFVFRQLYTGSYQLYASMVGFKTHTESVTVLPTGGPVITIILQEGADDLEGVTVSALAKTSSPDNLLNIQKGAMPVTVITRQMIEKMGSRRLDEVLKEQTGIAIVNDISGGARATGVQMQGFSSEYIMILIDGQPMTGRNAGNFDLSRISVSNIERIEIVKGASSCLFGSDALGGAINIVTRHGAIQPQVLASVIYGSMNIVDAGVEGETPFSHSRGSANFSANYYHSDGYNTDPGYISRGTTAPPYDDYSAQGRIRYRLTKKGIAGMSGRYALRKSYMEKIFQGQTGSESATGDKQDINDLNLSAYYNHDFSTRLKSMSRYYLTRYQSDMSVGGQQGGAGTEKFTQILHRFEQQWAYQYKQAVKLTGGIGAGLEQMRTNAHQDGNDMFNYFAYLQGEWKATDQTELVGGIRYDGNDFYGGSLNPSIGIQQKITSRLLFKLSAGTGFKAPDFKNRYQVFVNPASNYMVIGNEVLMSTLAEMQHNNEISEVRQYLLAQIAGNLSPEKSTSLNAGFAWTPVDNLKWEVAGFYHDLRNQINSIQIATGTGNRMIFTYQNLPRSFNTGIETSFSWKPVTGLEISGGYQYLIARDRSVRDSILAGGHPWYKVRNNATGETFDAKPSDYWGIENRSRHMGNLRVFYHWQAAGIHISIRANYRGKYPFGDANNNNFIDKYDQFAAGYFLLNSTVEKRFFNDQFRVRLTADNILDYTDRLIPGQPGRILLLGLSYRWLK
jgi:outer membrane receptor for ferrienterochelin and colicins